MLKPVSTSVTLGLGVILVACTTGRVDYGPGLRPDDAVASAPRYLSRAHSHNNYEQRRPLLDAIGRGFASIEVDVVLQGGELYVAHGPDDVDEEATLRHSYLDPLRGIVADNGGTVYGPEHPPLQLLVDVKTDAAETYALLDDVLRDYSGMLTTWTAGRTTPGAVSIVISGNRPLNGFDGAAIRYAALDGRLLDDRRGVGPGLMPLVSEDWEKLGPPVTAERLARARSVVEQMHTEGRKVRFWGTPEDEELWSALVAIGVDYIGTDQVDRLDRFLQESTDRTSTAID